MRKFYKVLNTVIFLLFSQIFLPQNTFANTMSSASHKCTTPKAYSLSESEVNSSNAEFYCWEIRYLRDYKKVLSMGKKSYYSLFPKGLSASNIEILRKLGITP